VPSNVLLGTNECDFGIIRFDFFFGFDLPNGLCLRVPVSWRSPSVPLQACTNYSYFHLHSQGTVMQGTHHPQLLYIGRQITRVSVGNKRGS
jgi:hypothetical protein